MTQTFSDGTPVPDEGDYGSGEDYHDLPGIGAQTHPLYRVFNRIATALEKLAENPSRPPSNAPGAPQGPPVAQSPGPPAQRPQNGPDPVKMGKKVYAICRAQGWDVAETGERITGHPMGANSQKWSVEDLKLVLDTMDGWNL